MKKVIVIFRNRRNPEAIQFMLNGIQAVFEDYIDLETVYVNELKPGTKLEADAYLVYAESLYNVLWAHIDDFNKVIHLKRSPNKRALETLKQLPVGAEVLVVNDSYQSSVETVYALYESGEANVKLTPFDAKKLSSGVYDSIRIAVTPGEAPSVPAHITEIYDIGYREISFETMLDLANLLGLNNPRVNRNLFHHVYEVSESNSSFLNFYTHDYLKSELLRKSIDYIPLGLLLFDDEASLVSANTRAREIFGVRSDAEIHIADYIDEERLKSEDVYNEPIIIDGETYYYDRIVIPLMEGTAGFYITLQDAKTAVAKKQSLSKRGFVARYSFKDITYASEKMARVISMARRIAKNDETVLIRGESGTGKELIAQSLHNNSDRRDMPFVAINCASLPETLLESELFGYEPGAFTGARSKGKVGLFEQANKGTIFLDEIGDISPKLQAQLLRTIQEMQVMKIGSDKIIDIDVRVIAATNKDLETAIEEGTFRRDLFYRISVLPLVIPPLRQRKDDILPLFKDFLGAEYENITPQEQAILLAHSWPGNVRELRNVALYYHSLFQLPEYLLEGSSGPAVQEPVKTRHKTAAPAYSRTSVRFNENALRFYVLSSIYEGTEPAHGMGRSALLQILKAEGIGVSDSKLREVLADLAAEDLIIIGRGRHGTRITEKGTAWLQNNHL